VAAAANAAKLMLSHIKPVTETRLEEVIKVIKNMGRCGAGDTPLGQHSC